MTRRRSPSSVIRALARAHAEAERATLGRLVARIRAEPEQPLWEVMLLEHSLEPGGGSVDRPLLREAAWRHRHRFDALSVVHRGLGAGLPEDERLRRLEVLLAESPGIIDVVLFVQLDWTPSPRAWTLLERLFKEGLFATVPEKDRLESEALFMARLEPKLFVVRYEDVLRRIDHAKPGQLAARLIRVGVPPTVERFLRHRLERLAPHERDPWSECSLACSDALKAIDSGNDAAAAAALARIARWLPRADFTAPQVNEVLTRARRVPGLKAACRDVLRVRRREWRPRGFPDHLLEPRGVTLRALLTLARRRPNDLLALRDVAFWRGAVRPSLRSTVRAAAERFIAKVPETRTLPAFLRWASVKDARAWVRRIRRPTRAATCAERAWVLLEASRAQPAKAKAFIQAAHRWFDEIPRRMRALWPGVWAHLAAARGDDELLGCLMEIGHGLMAQDRYAEFFFPVPSLLTPERRARAQHIVDALSFEGPRRFVRAHDRLQAHMRRGLRAIEAGDVRALRRVFTSFLDELPYESFPGNFAGLFRAAIEHGLELESCHRGLTMALENEWRSWVRPELLALKQRLDERAG